MAEKLLNNFHYLATKVDTIQSKISDEVRNLREQFNRFKLEFAVSKNTNSILWILEVAYILGIQIFKNQHVNSCHFRGKQA